MHIRLRTSATAACLAFGLLTASGQELEGSSAGKEPIALNVVVTPGNHTKAVPGLPQASFTVLDNGAPQPITSFRAVDGKTEPVKVLMVVDAVNVDFQRVAYEREQIDRFLHANDGQLSQPTSLAIFTDDGTRIEPAFTTDGNALSQEFDKQVIGLRELRRSAGFYGAEERIDLSLKALDQLITRATTQPGRKFIVWITPGWPLLSGPEVELSSKQQDQIFNEVMAFSDALRRSRTTVYVVNPLGAGASPGRTFYFEDFLKGIKKPSQAVPGDLGVQVLAEQSGGKVVTGSNDIADELAQCYADAAAHYEIAFRPPPPEGPAEYHRIEVRLSDTQLKARTTQGYYSPR